MSWLLFLDESGHDHKGTPYEVRGGVAVHAGKLWPFIQSVRNLEQATFGVYLSEVGMEIKGEKLLRKDRFKWAAQAAPIETSARRKHALNFLNSGKQGRTPRRDEFTAFGQACTDFAEGIITLLDGYDAKLFAAIIPAVRAPASAPTEYLRKDHVFLFERYFAFLEERREHGLIVMDCTQKEEDKRFVHRMERYFTLTQTGKHRTAWIVPTPLFVESDMAYGVQAADVIIYALNWAFRLNTMDKPTRSELEPLVQRIKPLIWHGDVHKDGQVHRSHGVVYIPDPYEDRRGLWQK
ncbi:MAG: DUF3800 domain-containing protein [Phycisphaerales bacterium]